MPARPWCKAGVHFFFFFVPRALQGTLFYVCSGAGRRGTLLFVCTISVRYFLFVPSRRGVHYFLFNVCTWPWVHNFMLVPGYIVLCLHPARPGPGTLLLFVPGYVTFRLSFVRGPVHFLFVPGRGRPGTFLVITGAAYIFSLFRGTFCKNFKQNWHCHAHCDSRTWHTRKLYDRVSWIRAVNLRSVSRYNVVPHWMILEPLTWIFPNRVVK
jgi:hypothetical protein